MRFGRGGPGELARPGLLKLAESGTPGRVIEQGAQRDAVAYTEPDEDSIRNGLRSLLDDPARRAALGELEQDRAREFTWAASAEAHMASYQRAAAQKAE